MNDLQLIHNKISSNYTVIAPKEGRSFSTDAAALAELKKSILNGIGFDCLIKDILNNEGTLDRVLGLYEDGSLIFAFNAGDGEIYHIEIPYTVTQYQGLAAVQEAMDEEYGLMDSLPQLRNSGHLGIDGTVIPICVDDKYLTVTGSETIEALTIAETGPTENFVNITWEDAQKLIGLPLV